jgi:hypothetical protein
VDVAQFGLAQSGQFAAGVVEAGHRDHDLTVLQRAGSVAGQNRSAGPAFRTLATAFDEVVQPHDCPRNQAL